MLLNTKMRICEKPQWLSKLGCASFYGEKGEAFQTGVIYHFFLFNIKEIY